ncbi:prostate and testis expressed protein 1 [Erinaceus europaeus]|uniref:Prostate and testis expressed protein 1 n=1 Tax=Erinaceus europaeus TaxID=9365 RepID=A0ABM3WH20_ERIEU|nr:prostate and testis expressed protein 1 [Erinaceus europaeus]
MGRGQRGSSRGYSNLVKMSTFQEFRSRKHSAVYPKNDSGSRGSDYIWDPLHNNNHTVGQVVSLWVKHGDGTREILVNEDHIHDIIQCRMCHLQFPGEKCSRGRGVCIATKYESCTVGNILNNNGTLWLTFMGCLKNCANVDNIKWNVYFVTFRCCRDYDFCNEFL